jgi:DNA-binding response OmpR family regulator
MLPNNEFYCKVILLGLPPSVAETLGHVLSNWGVTLYIPPETPAAQTLSLIEAANPNLVFVWTGENVGMSLVKFIRSLNRSIPVIAVNRRVRTSEVLDALDSGAVDYCSPPFDATHIERLLITAHRSDHVVEAAVS